MNRTARTAAAAGFLAFAMAGCAHDPKPAHAITVKGQLAAGAECPMIVTADNRRYSLTGSLDRFKIGDRVCVRGRTVEVSTCMAGEATIAIDAIGPEDNCP